MNALSLLDEDFVKQLNPLMVKLIEEATSYDDELWLQVDISNGAYANYYLISNYGNLFSMRRGIIVHPQPGRSPRLLSKAGTRLAWSYDELIQAFAPEERRGKYSTK